MTPQEIMSNATVRVERIIWLPGATACLTIPDDLIDFIEDEFVDDDSEIRQELYDKFPHLSDIPLDDTEWLVDAGFSRCGGFLVQAATPVKTKIGNSKSVSYSWGYYHTRWLHVDAIEDVAPTIAAWAKHTDQNKDD